MEPTSFLIKNKKLNNIRNIRFKRILNLINTYYWFIRYKCQGKMDANRLSQKYSENLQFGQTLSIMYEI